MQRGIALITGASRGIGRGIALRLAKDGYQVALNDLPREQSRLAAVREEIHQGGGKAVIYPADVSDETDVKGMVGGVVGELGGLDVMVANAGIVIPKPFLETTVEEFRNILNVNAVGTYLCYKYAALQMIEQGRGGRIIGASSLAGKQGWPLLGSYSATKFAIRGLTQTAALELAPHGITVNAYAPGPVDTGMMTDLRSFAADLVQANEPPPHDITQSPVGYDATAEDIAGLVSYLVSKEARLITGQSISINGGMYFD